MRKSKLAAMCLVAPAFALSACGGTSDEDTITQIVKDVGDKPAVLCDHLSDKLTKDIGGAASCKDAAKGEKPDPADVESVKIDGEKATAKVKDSDGLTTVGFVKQDGDWVVDTIS
jgi:hypothetical protein